MNAWAGFFLRYLVTGIGVSLLLVAFIPRPPETTPPDGPSAARDGRRAAAVQADLERMADSGQHFVDLVENIPLADEPRRTVASAPASSSRWAVVTSPKAPSYEVQRLQAERARLKIEIDTRIAQRETRLRADNPYADAYAKARKALQAYARRIKALREGHDTSEGADRMHYANELRSMKGRDITLRTNLENAKSQYEEWNLRHPDAVPTDTGIASLTEELDRIERRLEALSSAR